jgi:hypothetical protein
MKIDDPDEFMSKLHGKLREIPDEAERASAALWAIGDLAPAFFYEIGINSIEGLVQGMEDTSRAAKSSVESIPKQIIDAAKSELGIQSPSRAFEELGGNIIEGLTKGISSGTSSAVSSAVDVAKKIISATKKELGIQSPSRIFADIGRNTSLGFIEGIKDTESSINKTMNNVFGSLDRNVNVGWGVGGLNRGGIQQQTAAPTRIYERGAINISINADNVKSFNDVVKVFENLEAGMIATVGV